MWNIVIFDGENDESCEHRTCMADFKWYALEMNLVHFLHVVAAKNDIPWDEFSFFLKCNRWREWDTLEMNLVHLLVVII